MALASAERRRREQREDVRRSILEATESILAEGGYEGFSIRRLADRCGYTAPTIYHHFGDKNGLLDALLEARFQELLRWLRRVPGNGDPIATIRAQALAFLRFGLRNPTHYRMLAIARDPEAGPLPAVEQARAHLDRPWLELAEANRLLVDDIETAQRTTWALVHGLLSLRSSRPDLDWPRRMFEQAVDATLHGLVAPAPSETARPRRRNES